MVEAEREYLKLVKTDTANSCAYFHLAIINLKKGKILSAAKNIFDSRNLTSIKAVWEDRKWIGGVLLMNKPLIPVLARRVVSLVLGILYFSMVAPEFGWMPTFWIVFWTALPLAPAFCVFLAAGRNLILEAIGWGFLIGTGFLLLVG